MKMSCTCGTSTVMRIRTKAIVVAHNGHDNLVQELHWWNRPGSFNELQLWRLDRLLHVSTRRTNMLILHNRDVEHFVNGLKLDNLYGQLNRQTKGAVSAPRQE